MFITTGGGGGSMTAYTPNQSLSWLFSTPKSADERGGVPADVVENAKTNQADERIIISYLQCGRGNIIDK